MKPNHLSNISRCEAFLLKHYNRFFFLFVKCFNTLFNRIPHFYRTILIYIIRSLLTYIYTTHVPCTNASEMKKKFDCYPPVYPPQFTSQFTHGISQKIQSDWSSRIANCFFKLVDIDNVILNIKVPDSLK